MARIAAELYRLVDSQAQQVSVLRLCCCCLGLSLGCSKPAVPVKASPAGYDTNTAVHQHCYSAVPCLLLPSLAAHHHVRRSRKHCWWCEPPQGNASYPKAMQTQSRL